MLHRFQRPHLLLGIPAAVLMLASADAAAQTPDEVARLYLEATRKGDWKTSTAYMHPDELERFKQVFAPLVTSSNGTKALATLLGLQSPSELADLPPADVYTRFVTLFLGNTEEIIEMIDSMGTRVIGHVPEGNDTVHVVYRMMMKADGMHSVNMQVASLKRYGDTWRLMLEQNMVMMAETFAQNMGNAKE